MAEVEESENKYGKIVQWKDEKTLLKLGDFVEIIGGPHFGQRGSIAELFESKIALIELESKQRVKVKHDDFVLFAAPPLRGGNGSGPAASRGFRGGPSRPQPGGQRRGAHGPFPASAGGKTKT